MLFSGSEQELHLREVARQSGLTPAGIQKELDGLAKTGLIVPRRDGNRLYYRAATEHPLYPELRGLVTKTTGIQAQLREAIATIPGVEIAFIFGSVATGTAAASSDVDVMIIGTVGLRRLAPAMRRVSETASREINPHCLTAEEWSAKVKKRDIFVSRISTEPKLWIKGGPHELGRLG